MTFYYDSKQHPTMILGQDTSQRLLMAIRAGFIEMAYFPGLYHPDNKGSDEPEGSPEEWERFGEMMAKIKYHDTGKVILTRSLKEKLFTAVRLGEINLLSNFPELAKAYQSVKDDWSALSADENRFMLDFLHKVG